MNVPTKSFLGGRRTSSPLSCLIGATAVLKTIFLLLQVPQELRKQTHFSQRWPPLAVQHPVLLTRGMREDRTVDGENVRREGTGTNLGSCLHLVDHVVDQLGCSGVDIAADADAAEENES